MCIRANRLAILTFVMQNLNFHILASFVRELMLKKKLPSFHLLVKLNFVNFFFLLIEIKNKC